jgi:hypothetical protein
MERNGLGLDLSLLYVDLVATEDDRDVLAHADEVAYIKLVSSLDHDTPPVAVCLRGARRLRAGSSRTVPVGDVLVGNSRSNIKHNDTALAVDVVTITETTELLLAGGIPDVELDGAEVLGDKG